MTQNKIIKTDDGSFSIYSKRFDSTYHSVHGAIQESNHIFIKNGLDYYFSNNEIDDVNITEYGFGTGLNALLTLDYSKTKNIKINYTALEAFPISLNEASFLNYIEELNLGHLRSKFKEMHLKDTMKNIKFSTDFTFTKLKIEFEKYKRSEKQDIIFFDVFGAEIQPHLWLNPFLEKIYESLNTNGILITYGAKGSFKRALKSLGFTIQNPQGPPGKREITRALKQ